MQSDRQTRKQDLRIRTHATKIAESAKKDGQLEIHLQYYVNLQYYQVSTVYWM